MVSYTSRKERIPLRNVIIDLQCFDLICGTQNKHIQTLEMGFLLPICSLISREKSSLIMYLRTAEGSSKDNETNNVKL